MDAIIAKFNAIYSFDAQLKLWVGILAGTLAFMALERFFHAKPPFKGLASNLKAAPLMILGSPLVAIVPTVLVSDALAHREGWMYPITLNFQEYALWLDESRIFGGQQTLAASISMFFCFLLLVDFFYYWFHRLQHTGILWPQHRLHHSDACLNVLTTHRHNWLEESARLCFMLLPMQLIFDIKPVHIGFMGTVITLWVYLLHANLRFSFGPFTPIIAGPQYHRIHHSIESAHHNKNFATYFPVWDIVFGTYYRPKRGEFPETGVNGVTSDASWREIIWPFSAPSPSPARQPRGGQARV